MLNKLRRRQLKFGCEQPIKSGHEFGSGTPKEISMSVAGVAASNGFNIQNSPTNFQQAQKDFQQLGSDLQSGNLSAAKSDFTTLQGVLPPRLSGPPTLAQTYNPVAQNFSQLGQDLKSGNLSGARHEYAAIRQHFATRSDGPIDGDDSQKAVSQLGSALEAGNLKAAENAFSLLTHQLQTQNVAQPLAATRVSVSA